METSSKQLAAHEPELDEEAFEFPEHRIVEESEDTNSGHSASSSDAEDERLWRSGESPEIMMNAMFLLELTNPSLKNALTELEPLVLTRTLTQPRRTFEDLYAMYKQRKKEHEKAHKQQVLYKRAREESSPEFEERDVDLPAMFANGRLPPLPTPNPKEGFAAPPYHTHPELYQQHVRLASSNVNSPSFSSSGSSSSLGKRTRSQTQQHMHASPASPNLLPSSTYVSSPHGVSAPTTRSRARETGELLQSLGSTTHSSIHHTNNNSNSTSPYMKAQLVPLPSPVAPSPLSAAATPTSPTRKRRKVERKRATPDQVEVLEKIYAGDRFPSTEVIKDVADKLGMKQQKVKNWFQNKRAKERRMGVELIPPAPSKKRSSSDEASPNLEESDKQKNESINA